MTMKRRDFLNTAALSASAALASSVGLRAEQAKVPASPKGGFKIRPAGNVEILFKAPGDASNGLEVTAEGVWTIDPATSRTTTPGICKVYFCSFEGKVLRELSPEGTGTSGIGTDGKTLWIASTYSREIIRVDAMTGATLEKHMTPGAGVIYNMVGDPEPRTDTYASRAQAEAGVGRGAGAGRQGRAGGGGAAAGGGGGRGRGGAPGAGGPTSFPGPPGPGTGAHGITIKNGKMWVAVPPSRMIYRLDPATWTVEHMFPSVGNRPHGIGFEGDYLWEADTNLAAFYKRDPESGEIVDCIRLDDGQPFPHGMDVRDGYIYYCDDIHDGLTPVCRIKI
jgi:streptogramin lyase